MKIQRFRYLFLILSLAGCKKNSYEFAAIAPESVKDFDPGFRAYCRLDMQGNFELNAVQSSFYGDYQNALDQATKKEALDKPALASIILEGGETDKGYPPG